MLLVLTGTIAKWVAGGSVNLAATLRKMNWGRRAWFMSLLFLELFRTICSFMTYAIFDELEGRSNNILHAVLLLMVGGDILLIVVTKEEEQVGGWRRTKQLQTTRYLCISKLQFKCEGQFKGTRFTTTTFVQCLTLHCKEELMGSSLPLLGSGATP